MLHVDSSLGSNAVTSDAPAATPDAATRGGTAPWWRGAVTYQLYIRSFADANGDGLGDVAGIRSRLPYLAGLGVDAIWVNPWYPSPQADAGYDVADYRDIEPAFGTLDEALGLIEDAHAHGLRVLLDIVPNHTSDEHPWFAAALAAGPGSPERARYVFRPGKGPDGSEPPNDWRATFGGPAWTRVTEADGTPGEWYLHLFDPKQPDVNWDNPEVRAEFLDVLRFWFDRGADGFRIDVAHGLVKQAGLPDLGHDVEHVLDAARPRRPPALGPPRGARHLPGVARLADSLRPAAGVRRRGVGASPERLAAYLRPDELHTAFDFDFVRAPWDAAELRRTAQASLAAHDSVGAPVMWVLSNHDITRHVTRSGGGSRRVRCRCSAAARRSRRTSRWAARGPAPRCCSSWRCPGGVYLYQGEELGLEEVLDLPDELLQDPTWVRSRAHRPRPGRLPGAAALDGVGPLARFRVGRAVAAPARRLVAAVGRGAGARPRLDADALPARAPAAAGAARTRRRARPATCAGSTWARTSSRSPATRGSCACSTWAPSRCQLPRGEVLLASDPVFDGGELPQDTAAWLRTPDPPPPALPPLPSPLRLPVPARHPAPRSPLPGHRCRIKEFSGIKESGPPAAGPAAARPCR